MSERRLAGGSKSPTTNKVKKHNNNPLLIKNLVKKSKRLYRFYSFKMDDSDI